MHGYHNTISAIFLIRCFKFFSKRIYKNKHSNILIYYAPIDGKRDKNLPVQIEYILKNTFCKWNLKRNVSCKGTIPF